MADRLRPSPAAQASRALARSGLTVVRVPEDIETLREFGFPEQNREGIRALRSLDLIRPVGRGIYEVRDPSGRVRGGLERLVAAKLSGTAHLVTGWWALADAQLTNQDVRELVVLTPSKRRGLTLSGKRVHVVAAPEAELWGGRKRASGLIVAEPARALCDCAARRSTRIPAPRLAEALERFLEGRDARKRLVWAVDRYHSPVAARRLGFLAELITGEEWRELRQLAGRSKRPEPLDPGDDSAAPVNTRWGIRTRLGEDELLEHRRVS